MNFRKNLEALIKKFDLFSQPISFRYNQEPEYQSLTGGVISIVLIIGFIGIFSSTLFRTVNKEYINFNLSKKDNESPSYFVTTLDHTFMFAIGIDFLDLNSGQRYFEIYLQQKEYNSSGKFKQNIPLVPCSRDMWESRGYADTYDRLKLEKWLCPPEGTNLQLQGKFTSQHFKFYKIGVKQCNSSVDPSRPCVNSSTIESFLDANQAFNFNYYFINTIINPGDDDYLGTYLEDTNYFPFSPTDGISANLFISSYEINTDESFWPIEDNQMNEGGIVLQKAQVMNYKVRLEYLKLYLRKSPISISIDRSFRKIDDTLSYIGGLFGTILVFFGFVSMYNELSYEIQITRHAYYIDKNDPFDPRQFNIIVFFVYVIYEFLDRFGLAIPWERFQRLHRFLEEGKKQMDMRLIMNKILYAERLGLALLDKSKHKALLLSEPFTLDEADEIRKDLNFYKNFRKKFFSNGESVEQSEKILFYDLSKKELKTDSFAKDNINDSKIHPVEGGETSIIEPTSTQLLETEQSNENKVKPKQVEDEDEFRQMDLDMRESLKNLQLEAQGNDKLARKLLEKIDPRIKKRYLVEMEESPKRLKKLKPLKAPFKKQSEKNETEDRKIYTIQQTLKMV